MSGFGSLYYTDCRPGQGLQGTAGFQFQAASPGLAADAMPLVAQAALYEAPAAWMREQRPVADYPGSLSHVADGGLLATAAGCYLGKEANGNREGNQFTHAVITRDGGDYGLVRPAQLWEAPWWAVRPADGTTLETLPPHPQTGPLDTESVHGRVVARPGGQEWLVALLSAVHRLSDPATRRAIVIVSADPEEVACWIAAATMLLPSRAALRTTFKIFVADARYSDHDIIGVHPEWAGRWADTGTNTGLAVFDLDHDRHSVVEPTDLAGFWVDRFFTEDPYDVVDAVELAGQFADARDDATPQTPADRLVALVMAAGVRLSTTDEVDAAARWLLDAPEKAIAMAREIVVDAVLESRPPAPVLRTLAEAAGSRGWDIITVIQHGLFGAELDEVRAARDGAAALTQMREHAGLLHIGPPAAEEDRERDRRSLETALATAAPDLFPALLQLARRHKIPHRGEQFDAAAWRFVTWWLTCTDPSFIPERWEPASTELLPWVRAQLQAWLAGDGDRAADAQAVVEARWWRPLWREARHPTEALDELLLSTAYRRLPLLEQSMLMRRVQSALAEEPLASIHPASRAWQILFGTRPPTFDEAVSFANGLVSSGLPVSDDVAVGLCAVLDAEPRITDVTIGIARQIKADGRELSPRQVERLEQDRWVGLIAADLRAPKEPPESSPIHARLAKTELALLRARAETLVDALLDAPRARALAVVRACGRGTLAPLYDELKRRWYRPTATVDGKLAAAAAFTFTLTGAEPRTADQVEDYQRLRSQLAEVVNPMTPEDRARIARAGTLGEDWWTWVADIEPRRWGLGKLTRSNRQSPKAR